MDNNHNRSLVRLRLITHNARLVDTRRDSGFTLPAFAEALDMAVSRLRAIEGLKRIPSEDDVCRIAILLEKPTDWLFPDSLTRAVEANVFAKRKVELEAPQLDGLTEARSPLLLSDGGIGEVEEKVDQEMAHHRIDEVLSSLTDMEARVVRLKYGLEDGEEHSIRDIAKLFSLTYQRISQIEHKALRKLRHPTRSRHLRPVAKCRKTVPRPKMRRTRDDIRKGSCDICGEWVGEQKCQHILERHPEYRMHTSRMRVEKWVNPPRVYTMYHCGFCQYRNLSIGEMTRHIRECHSLMVAQG